MSPCGTCVVSIEQAEEGWDSAVEVVEHERIFACTTALEDTNLENFYRISCIYVWNIILAVKVSFSKVTLVSHSLMDIRMFYKIPSGEISQIDGLEAGKIIYEYLSLLVDKKFV